MQRKINRSRLSAGNDLLSRRQPAILHLRPRCHQHAWIYAPVRMEIGILQIYDLLCGCKSFSTAYDELELDTLGDKKTALWF